MHTHKLKVHPVDRLAFVDNGTKVLQGGGKFSKWEDDSEARNRRVQWQHQLEREAYAKGQGALTPNNT